MLGCVISRYFGFEKGVHKGLTITPRSSWQTFQEAEWAWERSTVWIVEEHQFWQRLRCSSSAFFMLSLKQLPSSPAIYSTHFSTYNKIPTLTSLATDVTILTNKFCVLMLDSVYGSYLIIALELEFAQIWPWNCRLSLVAAQVPPSDLLESVKAMVLLIGRSRWHSLKG